MIDQWLNSLSALIANNSWISPMFALVAGVLTSITTCALSSVPLVIGYVGGTSGNEPKRAFRLSIVFSLGMAFTFTILGTTASLLGRLLGSSNKWWYFVLGILMVMMALQTWEIFQFIPSTYLTSKNTKKGYAGALIAGILGGIFSSPCATPVLVVLLGIVARSGNVTWGILLLLFYSIGHSVLVLVAGTSIGFVRKITASSQYGRFSSVLKIVMGTAILAIALYMFYLSF